MTQQLALEKSKVKELESHLETQQDISRGLQEQISLLEQRIQSEEARSKDVKVCYENALFLLFCVIKIPSEIIAYVQKSNYWELDITS